MKKGNLYALAGLILILSILPAIFFIANFWGFNISKNASDWGTFGDYFGGILNSFFSFLTLVATIYIAYIISNIEENRNRENLKFEKEKLLREFREAEYKRINLELQKVWVGLTSGDKIASDIVYNCIIQVRYFRTSNKHLFDFLDDDEMYNLSDSLENLLKYFHGDESIDKDNVIDEFVERLDGFNRILQEFLIENYKKSI